jgi:6,7-dimethyl-8-ribityllumazine synthase
MAREISGDLVAKGLKFGVVVSRFNSLITEQLLKGCLDCLVRHGAAESDITVVRVPGGFEIPQAAHSLAVSKKFHAIITLGCVLRGETPHNEHIAREATRGIGQVALETGVPVAFGVLTPDTLEQAIERAGTKMGNKGWDAAMSAIEMANLTKRLKRK